MNASGKSPSRWRVVVIAGAVAVLASAVTPVAAAAMPAKQRVGDKRAPRPAPARPPRSSSGGAAHHLSLEWMIGAELRP